MVTDTRSALIENATDLVRRQGYSAFSYAGLAAAVGIRKASVHHHFANKEHLGVAIVADYTERLTELLIEISAQSSSAIECIATYSEPYRAGVESGQGCLCGVLAAEVGILPARVQNGVRQFFALNLRWLEQVLSQGCAAGELHPRVQPDREARTILATAQGAMSLALAMQDITVFEQAVAGMINGLRPIVD